MLISVYYKFSMSELVGKKEKGKQNYLKDIFYSKNQKERIGNP